MGAVGRGHFFIGLTIATAALSISVKTILITRAALAIRVKKILIAKAEMD